VRRLLSNSQLWLDLLVSAVLPWFIYRWLVSAHSEAAALWWSMLPPAVLAVLELMMVRRVDLITVISLGGIVISLVIDGLGGDARMILVRESLFTGAAGFVGLSSLCWRRPALFYMARASLARGDAARGDAFEVNWSGPRFRRMMYWMTSVWSGGLVLEAVIRIGLSRWMSVEHFLIVSPFLQYGMFGFLGLATYCYALHVRKQAQAAAG
jgi:hypothetical protein